VHGPKEREVIIWRSTWRNMGRLDRVCGSKWKLRDVSGLWKRSGLQVWRVYLGAGDVGWSARCGNGRKMAVKGGQGCVVLSPRERLAAWRDVLEDQRRSDASVS
jgi:hypothetical protein